MTLALRYCNYKKKSCFLKNILRHVSQASSTVLTGFLIFIYVKRSAVLIVISSGFSTLMKKKNYFRETCYNIKRFATGFGRAQSLLNFSLQIDE